MDNKNLEEIINPDGKTISTYIWSVLFIMLIGIITNILSENISYISLALIIIAMLLLVVVSFIEKKKEDKRIEKLKSLKFDNLISSKELIRDYKGLIAFISNPPKNKNDDEWMKECKDEIKLAANKKESKITDISGIGQTFKAIYHHINKLKYCWLIYSDESGINVDILEHFFKKIPNNVNEPKFIKINDANDTKHIKEQIDNIYNHLPKDLEVIDVIADITAGNKPMTAGMVLSCSREDRNIEYIEQSDRKAIIEVDISPKFTGVDLLNRI